MSLRRIGASITKLTAKRAYQAVAGERGVSQAADFPRSQVRFLGVSRRFGSSSGVALSNLYPEAKSVWQWLRYGWYISVAYVIGFFVMLVVCKWRPDAPH